MPTTTWEVAREEITRPFGTVEFVTKTGTNITTNQLVVSTELSDNYTQDDYFIGWYVLIDGVQNANVVRRVTDYVASSGTLTVAGRLLQPRGV